MDFKIKAIFSIALLALASANTHAYQSETIYNKKGEAVFEFRIYNPGDGVYDISNIGSRESTFAIDENGRRKIRAALERWAEMLTLKPGYRPAIINLGTYDDANAGVYSIDTSDKSDPNYLAITALQAALSNQLKESEFHQAQAVISVGRMPFDTAPGTPSQLPLTGQVDYTATIFNELGHAMGITKRVFDLYGPGTATP